METGLLQFALTAYVTLIVVVDPLGVAPMFVGITQGLDSGARRRTLLRAVTIAFAVTLFFLLAGRIMLSYLGVSVHAFAISGGILLFITAMPMLFGQRPRLQAPEQGTQGRSGDDVAVFPLAIPLLAGPGAIASTLVLANEAGADVRRIGVLALTTAAVFVTTWFILGTAGWLMNCLGEDRIHIVTRVLGIVLAALAVQFVLTGIQGYYESLQSH
jgi:multiple antibiotic resistance protein